jgi:hypothetical protein
MCASVRVFACVTIWRAITAQCNAALLTRAQMDPRGADFYTLGALANFGLLDRTNRVEMRTSSVGHRLILAQVQTDLRKRCRKVYGDR